MLQKIVQTDNKLYLTILRVALGAVIFAHGAQKMLGWFGGGGFSATINGFSQYMHITAPVAAMVIFIEFFGSLMLIAGAFTRVAALGVLGLFIGIVLFTHTSSFFMNWGGDAKSEGLEYFLLIYGMSLTLLAGGAGRFSIDRKLSNSISNNNQNQKS